MRDIGFPELVVILVVALLVFGPSRLRDMGRSLGRALREFRDAIRGGGSSGDSEAWQRLQEADHPSGPGGPRAGS